MSDPSFSPDDLPNEFMIHNGEVVHAERMFTQADLNNAVQVHTAASLEQALVVVNNESKQHGWHDQTNGLRVCMGIKEAIRALIDEPASQALAAHVQAKVEAALRLHEICDKDKYDAEIATLRQQLAAAEAHEKLAVAEARLDEHRSSCNRCRHIRQPSMEGPRPSGCSREAELQAAVDAARGGK